MLGGGDQEEGVEAAASEQSLFSSIPSLVLRAPGEGGGIQGYCRVHLPEPGGQATGPDSHG